MTTVAPGMRSYVKRTIRGTYELHEYLAEGNFGAVYRSEQTFLGRRLRRVALKLSKHPGIDSRKLQEQLTDVFILAEAMDEMTDAAARSHLVHIYDAGVWKEEQDRAYVVMEFVQGRPLDRVIESYNGRVPETILFEWARQICRALSELHSLVPPVLHRDLKPNNILLEHDRHIRIVDFGLSARLLHQGYVPGTAGTIAYMAPETSMGQSGPASDVYSIGLILYESLTGKLPLSHLIPPPGTPASAQPGWLYKQKSQTPVIPPSQENHTVSKRMDAIVVRCLKFNPSERFLTASDLLRELERPEDKPPDLVALEQGRRLESQGDRAGARSAFERGLQLPSSSKQTRFELLNELGTLLVEIGEPSSGAQSLVQAWELVKEGAILRTADARDGHVRKIADAYEAAGNAMMARRWRNLVQESRV